MHLASALLLTGFGCNDPSSAGGEQNSGYVKIHSAASGSSRFEIWSKTGASLIYGYNDIGFKVFQNETELSGGHVKFYPTMYHGVGGPSHSVPVKEFFYYDQSSKLFKGYAIFIMYDESAFWAADYNFNDQIILDSSIFSITLDERSQIRVWDNSTTQRTYVLSLVSPIYPRTGLSELNLMLHETIDLESYREIDSAAMTIRTWMDSFGHGSDNNVNPISLGGGVYRGTVNFTRTGGWGVYDSISHNGSVLTRTPPPMLNFEVQ